MTTQQQFCPKCAYIGVIVANGRAECPLCQWKGEARETLGAITTETFWDEKKVGDLMLVVLARHAAGPLIQALEHIGLLPRMITLPGADLVEGTAEYSKARERFYDPLTPKWNEAAQVARNATMQAIMEASLTTALTEAVRQNKLFAIATDSQQHPMIEQNEREFGGDIKK